MSYDLMAFNPGATPRSRGAFMKNVTRALTGTATLDHADPSFPWGFFGVDWWGFLGRTGPR